MKGPKTRRTKYSFALIFDSPSESILMFPLSKVRWGRKREKSRSGSINIRTDADKSSDERHRSNRLVRTLADEKSNLLVG